jgi:2-keto-4-pentenoate hydratase
VDSLDHAYEIQKAMVSIGPTTALGPHAGWKAGGTNAAAQKTLGLAGPFRGPLFESGLTPSPGSLSKSKYNLNLLEPEFGFRLKADINHGDTVEQAWAAVEEVTLVIEACGSRCALAGVLAGGSTFQRVADGGIGSHVILGPTMNAAAAKAADLSGVDIELSVNGEVKVRGSGSAVFGDPINSLLFLAEEIGKFGHTLKAGEFIITGATCILPPTEYEEGDLISANFVGLGTVTLSTGGAAKL